MIRNYGGTEYLIGHYLQRNVVTLMCCWKITYCWWHSDTYSFE